MGDMREGLQELEFNFGFLSDEEASEIMAYFHSQGLVQLVEGAELPKDKDCTRTRRVFFGKKELHAFDTGYFTCGQDMRKTGWSKYKPLIEAAE